MKEENKNGQLPEKEQLLSSLRNAEEMYVFMSLCTKMPYVLCDEETFDDEVLLYYTEEDAQREGKKLIEQRIPIQIAKIEKKQQQKFKENSGGDSYEYSAVRMFSGRGGISEFFQGS